MVERRLFAHAALQGVLTVIGYAGAAAAKLSAYIIAALQNVQLLRIEYSLKLMPMASSFS